MEKDSTHKHVTEKCHIQIKIDGKEVREFQTPLISTTSAARDISDQLSRPVPPEDITEALEKISPCESAKADGEGLYTAKVGITSDFKISIKNSDGTPLIETYELSAEIEAPKSPFIVIKAINDGGNFKATYKPSAKGIHKIYIRDGKDIRESPFTVDVTS